MVLKMKPKERTRAVVPFKESVETHTVAQEMFLSFTVICSPHPQCCTRSERVIAAAARFLCALVQMQGARPCDPDGPGDQADWRAEPRAGVAR